LTGAVAAGRNLIHSGFQKQRFIKHFITVHGDF
jgi:hypothetical protein